MKIIKKNYPGSIHVRNEFSSPNAQNSYALKRFQIDGYAKPFLLKDIV
jgi:hypothetical protein